MQKFIQTAFDKITDMAYKQTHSALNQWTPLQLLAHCRDSRPDNAHEPFCFELFRRAIAEKSEQCWAVIYQQYQKLVYRWVLDFAKSSDPIDDLSIEDLVMDAFTAFWRAYTIEKLNNAGGLGSILSYLKSCVATTVLQARRKAGKTLLKTEWDESVIDTQPATTNAADWEQMSFKQVSVNQLWTIVDSCCHDEKERVIARLSFVADLKPNNILEHYPDLFADVAEIYTVRRNLKNRLKRNAQLRAWQEESSL